MAFACAVFSHQILDAMWSVPSTWYFPLLGPFPVFIIPDYVGHYFWLEVSSLSEWMFAGASLVIIVLWYLSMPEPRVIFQKNQRTRTARIIMAILLGGMGIYLLYFGLASLPSAFFAPTYNPATDLMAGVLALFGSPCEIAWDPPSYREIINAHHLCVNPRPVMVFSRKNAFLKIIGT